VDSIFNEFAPDCSATAAWLRAAVTQDDPKLVARCEAFYAAAQAEQDQPLLDWIGGELGLCEPAPLPEYRKGNMPVQVAGDFIKLAKLVDAYF